jgi:hypothetical protein
MTADDVRRWIASFEAAAAADRAAQRTRSSRPPDPIHQSLSMINAVHRSGEGRVPDAVRERDAERVRATWARLRERLGR